ncbi:DoxX family membrane protein [Dyella sp.]|uniref:DoxX family membrane protein n=1 Tax=Dyella sp. TaxID=1869338 RepID=UPI003216ABCD
MFALPWLASLGYVLLGLYYAVNGALHFRHFAGLSAALSARRIPCADATLAIGSIFQLIAGTMLALQFQLRLAALGLAAFTVLASLMMLDFRRAEGAAREAAIRAWQANLALTGALLAIARA